MEKCPDAIRRELLGSLFTEGLSGAWSSGTVDRQQRREVASQAVRRTTVGDLRHLIAGIRGTEGDSCLLWRWLRQSAVAEVHVRSLEAQHVFVRRTRAPP